MRATALIPGLSAIAACSVLSSSDVEESASETGQEINAAECRPPSDFEAHYDDGSVLVKAQELEDGGSVWTYYAQPKIRALSEVRKRGHVVRVATYHANGKPHVHGAIKRDPESGRERAEGIWEMFADDGDIQARALISEGELYTSSAEAWDRDGTELAWSLPENVFSYQEAESIESIRAPYPANARGESEKKRTCTLVCLDEHGEKVGIFRLPGASAAFNESSEAAIRLARFHPRRIGGNGVPSCMTVSINYELMWATKILRLPPPDQRRRRGRRY